MHALGDVNKMKWFWADLHFDHDAIVTKMGRPAECPEAWYHEAITAININVKRTDWLYLLGDFAWKRPGFWRSQIRCKNIYLIVGNHDPGPVKLKNVFGGNFSEYKMVKCCGVPTVLCHYPFAFWDKSHRGSYHLHGHLHYNKHREAMMDQMQLPFNADTGKRRSMDVAPEHSLERWGYYRPFNEEDVHEILGARKGHDFPKGDPEWADTDKADEAADQSSS